ncbi:hypothetical protein GWO43_21950 [candidate division KSB1 bacterium]|nr:hypothetical protein [candidate division KSB1 bacterium]NIR72413.1 hypothetical protein [candidate division KSB1 bacterium]NIS26743.1 hypothetical protein [candidate division KSB1 bacterium]NIT73490.1 hypothetical protein [candidate division KSB1 bacterium]NIU27358.1 hypothetical protein [candidate division KSB1 bacterium]
MERRIHHIVVESSEVLFALSPFYSRWHPANPTYQNPMLSQNLIVKHT